MFWDKSRLVIGLQFSIFLSLAVSVLYVYTRSTLLLAAHAIPVALFLLLLVMLRPLAKKGFTKYALVFGYIAIVVIIVPPLLALAPLPGGLVYLLPLMLGLVFALGLTKRRQVDAKVILADRDYAVVLIDYDLFNNAKPGYYAAENGVGAKKGDTVRVAMRKSLTYEKPCEIVSKK